MSNLKPLQSLSAPNAERLDARNVRQGRTGVMVLVVVLVVALAGAGAGLAWMLAARPAGPARPAAAVALEDHL